MAKEELQYTKPLLIYFFDHSEQHVVSQFPNQRSHPCPLHKKHRVLTSGSPGKSLQYTIVVVQSPSCVRFLRSHGLQPARLLCPWDSPGKNTGVGCCFFLQEIFLTQALNPGLLHCRQILYQLSYKESPLQYTSHFKYSGGLAPWIFWICFYVEMGKKELSPISLERRLYLYLSICSG